MRRFNSIKAKWIVDAPNPAIIDMKMLRNFMRVAVNFRAD
jgi:hypothetical protein